MASLTSSWDATKSAVSTLTDQACRPDALEAFQAGEPWLPALLFLFLCVTSSAVSLLLMQWCLICSY